MQDRVVQNKDLEIVVNSFSYKKNPLPVDSDLHGGGYIFDCRGILNPGRIDEYKICSGCDDNVITYLEQETKMKEYLEAVFTLISISIDDYLARGFDFLSISFGCTGGQHRSVYAAERTVRFIKEKYGIQPRLQHQNKEGWLKHLPSGSL